ncbi:MAG TPA: hypothetical protein DIU14_01625 [Actinobacteria bacterium]|nr:hypothetical protein [Actinomycetota bacterium]
MVTSVSRYRLVTMGPKGEYRWTFQAGACSISGKWIGHPGGFGGGGSCWGDAYVQTGSVGGNIHYGPSFEILGGRTIPTAGYRIRVTLANGDRTVVSPRQGLWMVVVSRCGDVGGTEITSIEVLSSSGKVVDRQPIRGGPGAVC